jgi:hypothetical protein
VGVGQFFLVHFADALRSLLSLMLDEDNLAAFILLILENKTQCYFFLAWHIDVLYITHQLGLDWVLSLISRSEQSTDAA